MTEANKYKVSIVVPSSFRWNDERGQWLESDFYRWYLSRKFSYCFAMIENCEGLETIEQIRNGIAKAMEKMADLSMGTLTIHIVWPCLEHYLRWWGIKGLFSVPNNVIIKHVVNFRGRPRPKEFITDIILAFGLPIIKLLGKIDWYLAKVNARREAGKI